MTLTLLAVLMLVASERASAVATSYWQDVAGDLNGNWTNVAHWSNANVPDTTDEYAYITTNSATAFTVTLDNTDSWASGPAKLKAIYITGSNARLKINGVRITELEWIEVEIGTNITLHLTNAAVKFKYEGANNSGGWYKNGCTLLMEDSWMNYNQQQFRNHNSTFTMIGSVLTNFYTQRGNGTGTEDLQSGTIWNWNRSYACGEMGALNVGKAGGFGTATVVGCVAANTINLYANGVIDGNGAVMGCAGLDMHIVSENGAGGRITASVIQLGRYNSAQNYQLDMDAGTVSATTLKVGINKDGAGYWWSPGLYYQTGGIGTYKTVYLWRTDSALPLRGSQLFKVTTNAVMRIIQGGNGIIKNQDNHDNESNSVIWGLSSDEWEFSGELRYESTTGTNNILAFGDASDVPVSEYDQLLPYILADYGIATLDLSDMTSCLKVNAAGTYGTNNALFVNRLLLSSAQIAQLTNDTITFLCGDYDLYYNPVVSSPELGENAAYPFFDGSGSLRALCETESIFASIPCSNVGSTW